MDAISKITTSYIYNETVLHFNLKGIIKGKDTVAKHISSVVFPLKFLHFEQIKVHKTLLMHSMKYLRNNKRRK